MKYDSDKSFGYPVLRPAEHGASPDYDRASFEPTFELTVDPRRGSEGAVILSFSMSMSQQELGYLINSGEATYAIGLRCRDTFFSRLRKVSQSGELIFSVSDLRGYIEITGLIVSTKNKLIRSKAINAEFGYEEFETEPGKVLAMSKPVRYFIEKDVFKSVRSIFDLAKRDGLKDGDLELDWSSGDYITITGSSNQYASLRAAETNDKNRMLVVNSVYAPVLAQALNDLRLDVAGELAEKRWAKVVVDKIEKAGIRFDDTTSDTLKIAHLLFKRPLILLNQHIGAS